MLRINNSLLIIFTFVFAGFAYALTTPQEYADYLAKTVDDVVSTIHATVPGAEIDHSDVLAIMCMEQQSLNIGIDSSAGAKGLTQVMPGTFNGYVRQNIQGFGNFARATGCTAEKLATDVRCSIEAGARIFNELLMRYNGDRTKAAIAYNAGPGRVGSATLPKETQDYAYRKLPACKNPIVEGRSPVANEIWQRLVQRVKEITGGKFSISGIAKVVLYQAGNQPFDSFTYGQTSKPKSFLDKLLSGDLFGGGSKNTRTDSGKGVLTSRDIFASGKVSNGNNVSVNVSGSKINPDTKEMILYCLPARVEVQEPALVAFVCPSGTSEAKSTDVDILNGDKYGILKIYPKETKDYSVTCVSKTETVTKTCKVIVE